MRDGGMAEWFKATVLKTVICASGSWVRILLPPYSSLRIRTPLDADRKGRENKLAGIVPVKRQDPKAKNGGAE